MTNSQWITGQGGHSKRTQWITGLPPAIVWAYGDNLFDNPVVWFSNEFMHRPLDGFEIDWGPLANNATEYLSSLDWNEVDNQCDPTRKPGEWVYPDCLKGVIIKLPERQRIWVLTGEYDYERNGHQGRWPD